MLPHCHSIPKDMTRRGIVPLRNHQRIYGHAQIEHYPYLCKLPLYDQVQVQGYRVSLPLPEVNKSCLIVFDSLS